MKERHQPDFSFSWNENPKEDLKSYFSWLEELSYEVDPLWTEGPDSSPVDRKNVKLLSGIEKNERSVYEAVLNLNGQKEAIVRVFSGVGSGGRALGQFMKVPGKNLANLESLKLWISRTLTVNSKNRRGVLSCPTRKVLTRKVLNLKIRLKVVLTDHRRCRAEKIAPDSMVRVDLVRLG